MKVDVSGSGIWLIEDILAKENMTIMAGAHGSGLTTAAYDIAEQFCVAYARRLDTSQLGVLWIPDSAYSGIKDISERTLTKGHAHLLRETFSIATTPNTPDEMLAVLGRTLPRICVLDGWMDALLLQDRLDLMQHLRYVGFSSRISYIVTSHDTPRREYYNRYASVVFDVKRESMTGISLTQVRNEVTPVYKRFEIDFVPLTRMVNSWSSF